MAKISINISKGVLKEKEIVFGIDLGTTNSLIAYVDHHLNTPIVIRDENDKALVPSILYFDDNNNVSVGFPKIEDKLDLNPTKIYSIKRLIGKSFSDYSQMELKLGYPVIQNKNEVDSLLIQIGNKSYSPIELSSFILKELKARAEKALNTKVEKVVITVPAYFNDIQRQATRDAGLLAGLNVLRIINEPTAASLAYGITVTDNHPKTIAVYDLGGGTFDISILQIDDGIYDILSTNGNTTLGGDDFDEAIVDYWIRKNNIEEKLALENISELKSLAEQAKISISNQDDYKATFLDQTLTLTNTELATICQPIINKTLESCRLAILDSGIEIEEITDVILVGGSTRMPLVKNAVSLFFNQVAQDTINPDEAVVVGAALQANIISSSSSDILLLDITPLSLGIETVGGLMDILIPRNSKVPISMARQYTTYKDGQSAIKIGVYQGERDLVQDNIKLGEFVLNGIPAMPAGLPKVEVKFQLDVDGILKVSAKELRSGVVQEVQLNPKQELTDQQVETSIKEAMDNAVKDLEVRKFLSEKVDADQLIETTEKFLIKNNSQISLEEKAQIELEISKLKIALESKIAAEIQQAMEALNLASTPLAERVLNLAIGKSLKGQKI